MSQISPAHRASLPVTPFLEVRNFEHAVELVMEAHADVLGVFEAMRDRSLELVRIYWRIGRIVQCEIDRETAQNGSTYGATVVEKLAEATAISAADLRHSRQFYSFVGGAVAFERWIAERLEEWGSVNWTRARNWMRVQLPSPEEDDRDEAAARLLTRLERRAQRFEQDVADLLNQFPDNPEVLGVATRTSQILQEFRLRAMQIITGKEQRDEYPQYLIWVAQQPCACCGVDTAVDVEGMSRPPCVAHHLDRGGTGTKGSDLFTVPLCDKHHDKIHRAKNENQVWWDWGVNPWQTVAELLREFVIQSLSSEEV